MRIGFFGSPWDRGAPPRPIRSSTSIVGRRHIHLSAPQRRGSRFPCASRNPRQFRESSAAAVACALSSTTGNGSVSSMVPTGGRARAGVPVTGTWNSRHRACVRLGRVRTAAGVPEIAMVVSDPLKPLGLDFLTFLTSTIFIVPVCKQLKVSPVLGFLTVGVILNQLGLFRNLGGMEQIGDLGVLFLLFEMGLELTLDRLKALATYAFGLGSLQMVVTSLTFCAFALPPGESIGTNILVRMFSSDTSLVSIRSVDEAIVIAAALSLSSSAFVLQLLAESRQLVSPSGSATLGVLLLQDIAVVPFLVLLPIVENTNIDIADMGTSLSLLEQLLPTGLKTMAGLCLLLFGGRLLLRRLFEVVAQARSNEAFVALCLATVTGTSLATELLGFSDTLGAFLAGVLLAESNFRSQVEADLKPFKGLLLGLFFMTTGGSMDLQLLAEQWQLVLALLVGLIAIKTTIIWRLAPFFGLSPKESLRTGLLLSQGGEFGFVLLSLASSLNVLPDELARLLIIVVVCSMFLTPFLAEYGGKFANWFYRDSTETWVDPISRSLEMLEDIPEEMLYRPLVICGYSQTGEVVAKMLSADMMPQQLKFVAFDMDPKRVREGRLAGHQVMFGDGSRQAVLEAAGIDEPLGFVIAHSTSASVVAAASRIRRDYGDSVPIFAWCPTRREVEVLQADGVDQVVTAAQSTGEDLALSVVQSLGHLEDVPLIPPAFSTMDFVEDDDAAVLAAMNASMDEALQMPPPPRPASVDEALQVPPPPRPAETEASEVPSSSSPRRQ